MAVRQSWAEPCTVLGCRAGRMKNIFLKLKQEAGKIEKMPCVTLELYQARGVPHPPVGGWASWTHPRGSIQPRRRHKLARFSPLLLKGTFQQDASFNRSWGEIDFTRGQVQEEFLAGRRCRVFGNREALLLNGSLHTGASRLDFYSKQLHVGRLSQKRRQCAPETCLWPADAILESRSMKPRVEDKIS